MRTLDYRAPAMSVATAQRVMPLAPKIRMARAGNLTFGMQDAIGCRAADVSRHRAVATAIHERCADRACEAMPAIVSKVIEFILSASVVVAFGHEVVTC